MLKYQGHVVGDAVCSCGQIHDARRLRTDPTGTRGIRRALMAELDLRWRAVRKMIRSVLVDQDLLGRRGGQIGADSALRVSAFSDWITSMVQTSVLDVGVVRSYVERASALGVRSASAEVGFGGVTRGRTDLITGLAISELRAIGAQVAQQSARAVSAGLLQGWNTARVVREVVAVLDRVGIARSRLVADHVVVRAYNDATLDVFEQAGHDSVDVMPELRAAVRVGDARKKRRKKPSPKQKSRKTGPGSRVSRARTPSASTIRRITRMEAETEAWAKRVNVQTAEDDDVCSICLDIAENGPYSIDRARSLIPAHPRCRCAFVPVRRKARVKDGTIMIGGVEMSKEEYRARKKAGTLPGQKVRSTPAPSATSSFREADHPRQPKGRETGGQFAEKTVGGFGGEKDIRGEGKSANSIREALNAVPEEHRHLLRDTRFFSAREITSLKSGREIDGVYMHGENTVRVADRAKGRAVRDRVGVAMHEIGHAVDFRSGKKITREIAPIAQREAQAMKPEERYLAQYWLKQDVEMAAEMYRLAYSPSNKGAFGLSRRRAEKVFASSLEKLRGMKL